MVSNGFWHIVSVVKELRPPCPAEWLPNNLMSIGTTVRKVNSGEKEILGISTSNLGVPVSDLETVTCRFLNRLAKSFRWWFLSFVACGTVRAPRKFGRPLPAIIAWRARTERECMFQLSLPRYSRVFAALFLC